MIDELISLPGEQSMKKSKLLELARKYLFDPISEIFKSEEVVILPTKKECADVIVRNNKGQVLLLHRTYTDDFMSGKWGFPGGHVDEGESAEMAAKRELFEETGLAVSGVRSLTTKELDNVIIHYYECFVVSPENHINNLANDIILNADEHRGYEWTDVSLVNQQELIGEMPQFIDSLLQLLTPCTFIESPSASTITELVSIDQAWQILEKAFNEELITPEQFFKAKENYFKKKKAEALDTITKAFDAEMITEEQYLKYVSVGKMNQ